MSARELAVNLSTLRASERQQLLDELPPRKRAELNVLLEEIAELENAPAASFETHMANVEVKPFANLNDGQLRLLLGAEHPSVQRRILAAVRDGQLPQLAPAVSAIVTEYLARKVRANEIQGSDEPASRPRHWWQRWTRTPR